MIVVHVLGWIFAAGAMVGIVYALFAALASAAFAGRRAPIGREHPNVSVLRPLCGASRGLEAALESYCAQDYPGEVQLVLGVQSPDDPALAVAQRLQARLSRVEIVVDETAHGQNRKVSNLINMLPRAKHDVIVLADADVIAPRHTLSTLVAELAEPDVGAVTCLYYGRGEDGIWSTLAAMAIDYQFAPNVLVGSALGLANACMGPTIAISRATLVSIGGFEAVANFLADDYEIGAAVRRRGARVLISSRTVTHDCAETTFRAFFDHEVRWARTIRKIDALGYAGSVVTHPFPLALVAAALMGFSATGLGLVAAALAARIGAKFAIDAAGGVRAGPWWLVPPSDLLSFATFLFGLTGDTVVWQGRRLRVGRDGAIET